jgi:hypothetical protein
MRVKNWHPEAYDQEIIGASMERLKAAGDLVAAHARRSVHIGTIRRPVYRKGQYAGAPWTKRDPGSLMKSIRVTQKPGANNVWVMAGNKITYYAMVHEHQYKFLKPALQRSIPAIRRILQYGV